MRRLPTDQGRVIRSRPSGRRGAFAGLGPAKLAAAAFALLVVCSLVAAGLGSTVLDRSLDDESPDEVSDEGQGEYEQSLREAIAANPQDAAAMNSLAGFLVTVGKSDEAIDWHERAIEIDPDNVQYRLDFGRTLADLGNHADAEVQYQRALAIDPQSVEAHFYLAELYRTWEPPRLEAAVEEYRRVIALAPDSVLAERAADELARLGLSAGTPAASPAGS